MRRFSLLFALVTLAFSFPSSQAGEFADNLTWDSAPAQRTAHASLEGKAMPALELGEWINGEVKTTDFRGKVVVLDFYATWCGPCMAAIPHNNELLKKYKDQGLAVIGVCTSSHGQEQFAENAKQHKIEYPAARDIKLTSEKAWQVHYYPTYAVVDRKGIVRVVGLQPQNVEGVVKKLLAEPAS